jgi:hypothetical protein
MLRFAIVADNVVRNVAIAEEAMNIDGTWINLTDITPEPGIGWTYENAAFTAPVIPTPSPLPSIITKLALLNRMTDAEFIGIINAAKTDAEVELWKTRFDNATTIDLNDGSRVVAGFPMLVTKALLTQARATEILTAPIQPDER